MKFTGLNTMAGEPQPVPASKATHRPPVSGTECGGGLLGNTLAVWLLQARERSTWDTGLLHLLSLPLLVCYYAGGQDWLFGETVCKAQRFLFTSNPYGSIFSIACIGLHRFVAVAYPLFTLSYVTKRHAKVAGLAEWLLVVAISSPVLKFASIETHHSTERK